MASPPSDLSLLPETPTTSSQKSLRTLPNDIYSILAPDIEHVADVRNLDEFARNITDLVKLRLGKADEERSPLRFSALGKPDRQLWYEAHPDGTKEKLSGKAQYKFLYGDIIEQLILFLAKEAGHSVESEQAEVDVDGIKGHIDAIIDGVVVDVKSASPYGFKKFDKGGVVEDDPFGYVEQLSGYADVLTPGEPAAWVAVDKVSGDICVSPLSSSIIQSHPPGPRISHLKEVIASEEPPERCYDAIPDGKSGNLKLSTACGYCAHKFRCWPNLRAFAYSTGPRFLTHVAKEPEVPEIKKEQVGQDDE